MGLTKLEAWLFEYLSTYVDFISDFFKSLFEQNSSAAQPYTSLTMDWSK